MPICTRYMLSPLLLGGTCSSLLCQHLPEPNQLSQTSCEFTPPPLQSYPTPPHPTPSCSICLHPYVTVYLSSSGPAILTHHKPSSRASRKRLTATSRTRSWPLCVWHWRRTCDSALISTSSWTTGIHSRWVWYVGVVCTCCY